MSNSRYYVVGNNDVWMIQFKDTENGQYKSILLALLSLPSKSKCRLEAENAVLRRPLGRRDAQRALNDPLEPDRAPQNIFA